MKKFSDKSHVMRFGRGLLHPSQHYVPSPIDKMRKVVWNVNKKDEVYSYKNDIYLLFNQKRLNGLGVDTVNNWLKSLTSSPSTDFVKGKYTDEQLLSVVKSRHIQSPSELKRWADYLYSRLAPFVKDTRSSQAAPASSGDVANVANDSNEPSQGSKVVSE